MSTAEERMQDAIDELEQENRLLRARNDRLEAEAKAVSVQECNPIDCQYIDGLGKTDCDWCRPKKLTTPPAAQRQWVGLTDDAKLDLISDAKGIGGRVRSDAQLFVLLDMQEAKLKEKNL
jgi:hypothetical protein